MLSYLTRVGVPARHIVRDYAGFDTWDSCVRARRIFGVERAIVVTQRFHLPRAVTFCRAAGIGHDSMPIRADTASYGYFREGIASTKALADVLTRREPRFLGPREAAVQRALGE